MPVATIMQNIRFSAPKRRTLAGGKGRNSLNDAYYASVRAEREKARKKGMKSRQSTAVVTAQGRQRRSLDYKGLATYNARRRLGSAIPPEEFDTWMNAPRPENGQALKEGIKRMAVEAGLSTADQELYNKLQRMDAEKLQYLYDKDELIFDVVFSYDENGRIGAGKKDDLRFLVESYETAFGTVRAWRVNRDSSPRTSSDSTPRRTTTALRRGCANGASMTVASRT